jgi:uncharacterized protein (DUF1501 family)
MSAYNQSSNNLLSAALPRAGIERRGLLRAALAAGGLYASGLTFAAPGSGQRLIVVNLRGALDGLSAVPPYGDTDYRRLRGRLAIGTPGTAGGALRLDSLLGLHPALAFMHERYLAKELLVFHAVATPYRERSHFDAQDVLEHGLTRPHEADSGWLNRGLSALPGVAAGSELGVALGNNVPLLMRGPAAVASWAPSRLPQVDDATLDRIMDLYATDPVLGARLGAALANDQIDAQANDAMADEPAMSRAAEPPRARAGDARQLEETVRTAAAFLRRPDGPRVAALETRGWDTHANQGDGNGQLALRLRGLDGALRSLHTALGETWRQTAILVVTEFGRTAASNGTGGTDHGTGSATFLLGGAVGGGRVVADWPGLAASKLYQGRDLAPTLDLRAVFKAVLLEHLGVPLRALNQTVFPGAEKVTPLRDLFRV